jgi:hypothetical protein
LADIRDSSILKARGGNLCSGGIALGIGPQQQGERVVRSGGVELKIAMGKRKRRRDCVESQGEV